jgi:HEAT repeat protein
MDGSMSRKPRGEGGALRPADEWDWKARRAVARFGPRAVPALVEALQGAPDPVIRRFAAETLGRLGAEAHPAAGALQERAHQDDDPAVRAAARAAVSALEARPER